VQVIINDKNVTCDSIGSNIIHHASPCQYCRQRLFQVMSESLSQNSIPGLVLFVLVLIWVADSAAFFVGRRFGRHKLASRVSPGKSWEGVAGGLLAVVLLAAGIAVANQPAIESPLLFVILSFAVAAASVLGDLVESLFKRRAGVKDSGTLIPGHGGVLDRIDSLTAAGPFFAAGWLLSGAMA